MKIYLPIIFYFFLLLTAISCVTAPGSSTSIKTFSRHHSGIATITKVYLINDTLMINFDWLSENNIGNPEILSKQVIKDIQDFNLSQKLKIGDKLKLHVTHFFKQSGSTTPELLKSLWRYAPTKAPDI